MEPLTAVEKLNNSNLFLTTREIANVLNVTPSAIYKRRQRYTIPFYKINGRLCFMRTALKSWAKKEL